MLIKTDKFDKFLNTQLKFISINRKVPIIKRGSYKDKKEGAFVTDIDLCQNVFASSSLIARLSQIIDRLDNTSITFVKLHCGIYKEFILPWNMDKEGNTDFDLQTARKWFVRLRRKHIVDDMTTSTIQDILWSETVTPAHLLQIRDLIRPYSKILWNKNEITVGKKTVRDETYDLVEEMKQGHMFIIRYLLKYALPNRIEYVLIDFSLVDKHFLKLAPLICDYYRQDIYKIFKSYKWLIKNEEKEHYFETMNGVEPYVAILNRLHLIQIGQEVNLISSTHLDKMEEDVAHHCKLYDIDPNDLDLEKTLKTRIDQFCLQHLRHFRNAIEEKKLENVSKMEEKTQFWANYE
jgi:hypothetical protein